MAEKTISTFMDPNSHGLGFLQPSQIKVNCKGVPVILFGDFSLPDADCDGDHPPIHCVPIAIFASLRVFTLNRGIHRRSDKRACGATTQPSLTGNTKVYAG